MLDPRLRQLHDEPRSGGNQSAHQRMINRRFNDRASCFAQRRLYCEGNAKKGGEDFLRLLLETANIRSTLIRNYGGVFRDRIFLCGATLCDLSLTRRTCRSRRVKVHLNGLADR